VAAGEAGGAAESTTGGAGAEEMHRAALTAKAPGLVIAVTPPEGDDGEVPELLRSRPTIAGEPTAYVCRGFVCQAPTTELSELNAQLG